MKRKTGSGLALFGQPNPRKENPMRRTSIVAAILALATLPFAAQAGPVLSVHGAPKAAASPAAHPDAGVLYDQTANDSGIAVVSQNFESSFDAYDSQAADDFMVPAGQVWRVTEIIATGAYFNGAGLARDENVTFYKGKVRGAPGKILHQANAVQGKDNGTGTFTIKLPWFQFWPGTYWVSVQANLDFLVGGEWGWENQTTSEGAPAMWQNPGNGFGTGCTTYQNEQMCIPDSPGDHMFVLKGVIR
jgi:hypothetical protein